MVRLVLLAGLTTLAATSLAATPNAHREAEGMTVPKALQQIPRTRASCLEQAARTAPPDTPARVLRHWCNPPRPENHRSPAHSALRTRLALEERADDNPFVLMPYRRNYFMPFSYWENRAWKDPSRSGKPEPYEVKFQISLKAAIVDEALGPYTLYGAFTLTSWWQAYNDDVSSPIRETNYAPSLFITRLVDWQLGPIDSERIAFGFIHESNGQSEPTSRSWNRIFASYIFRTGSYYWTFRPWYRIPEENADYPGDPDGDNNPNITEYLGNFSLTLSHPFGNHVIELTIRNNLNFVENRGSARLSYSFPLNEQFKGLVQVFTGYGDSLIHYNEYITRFSIGILLTDSL